MSRGTTTSPPPTPKRAEKKPAASPTATSVATLLASAAVTVSDRVRAALERRLLAPHVRGLRGPRRCARRPTWRSPDPRGPWRRSRSWLTEPRRPSAGGRRGRRPAPPSPRCWPRRPGSRRRGGPPGPRSGSGRGQSPECASEPIVRRTPAASAAARHGGVEVEAARLGVDLQEGPAPEGRLDEPGRGRRAPARGAPASGPVGWPMTSTKGLSTAATTRAVRRSAAWENAEWMLAVTQSNPASSSSSKSIRPSARMSTSVAFSTRMSSRRASSASISSHWRRTRSGSSPPAMARLWEWSLIAR